MKESNKPAIVCIVGPSGAGKTALSKHLEKELKIPYLVSFTTRPMRKGEKNGVDHWFVKPDMVPDKNRMLAHTRFGNHDYWTLKDDAVHYELCSYVIDEYGLLELLEGAEDEFDVFSVLIKRPVEDLVKTVGKERVERDSTRLRLSDDQYDLVIENNGSLEEFLEKGAKMIDNLIFE